MLVCMSLTFTQYCALCDCRLRMRPESASIRRTFRPSEGHGPGDGPPGAMASPRATSMPVGSLPKEGPEKRPVSAHGGLNSITRHSSLKTKVESPQLRKAATAGRSKSFSNHRPLDPEVIAQVEHSSQVCTTNIYIYTYKPWLATAVCTIQCVVL